ncbi:hypothetical protein HYH02_004144 [Chlamydomonas schloesseri]|uniref:LNS2/PITP domain-containing protein n=1 Tax=Chlamydomonas schloesseri TaxID=2026947 RepID=A0A835WRI3_9CHLO|nr:hypothetical protein HYH02_004144 [Chlamydomonas schloesseri]|eukprot:KAG2451546.1 hypothetical protein HYH02_004144 [Chlamydomonas schloesseri]
MRTRERDVKLYVNGELAPFSMHIGMYGQAYFTAEAEEAREGDEDEQDALLAGMMSPPSGYSSGAEGAEAGAGGSSAAAGETLAAVRQRIEGGAGGTGSSKVPRKGTGGADPAAAAAATGTGAPSRLSSRTPVPALGAAPAGVSAAAAVASSTGPIAPTPPASPPVGAAFGQQAAACTSSPASLIKAPSLAPLLTAADRNESFMSARETLSLATPLGEDLVAAATAASPGLLASRSSHAFRQSLHPGGGSSSSLAAVSEDGNEGASPRGWSEAGSEAGGGGDHHPGGASPPCRSPFGSPPAPVVPAVARSSSRAGAAGGGADGEAEGRGAAPPAAGPRQGRGHGSGDHGPTHQQWPAPGSAAVVSAMHTGGHYVGNSHQGHQHANHHPAQQPQHTQFGFPDNRSPAAAAAAAAASAAADGSGRAERDGAAAGDPGASGPYGVPAPLPLQLSGGGMHTSPPGPGSGPVMCAACGALSPSSAWPSLPPPHAAMGLPPLPHLPEPHGHGHAQQGARVQPSIDWAALLGPGTGAGGTGDAALPAGSSGGSPGPKSYAAVAAEAPHPHTHTHTHHPHYPAAPAPPPPELQRPYAVPIDLASLPRPLAGHHAAGGGGGTGGTSGIGVGHGQGGDSLAATTSEGPLPGHSSGSGSHHAVSLLSTSLRSAGKAPGSHMADAAAARAALSAASAAVSASAGGSATPPGAATARVVASIHAAPGGRVRLRLTVVAPPPQRLPTAFAAVAATAQPQLPGLAAVPGYGHVAAVGDGAYAAHVGVPAPAAAGYGHAGSALLDGSASAASQGGYLGDGERSVARALPGGGFVADAALGHHRHGIPVGPHGQHPHQHPHYRPHGHAQHAVHRDFGIAAAAGGAGAGGGAGAFSGKLGALTVDDAFPQSASAPLPVSALDAAAAAAAAASRAVGREAAVIGRTGTGGPSTVTGMQRVSSQAQLLAAARGAAGAAGAAALQQPQPQPQPSPPASSPLPPAAAVLELSLCGRLLTPQLPYPVVAALFDAQRLSEEAFAAQGGGGAALLSHPDLVVRLGATGAIYTWQSLSAALVGLLAFGTCRVPHDTPCWLPPAAAAAEGAGGAAAGDASAVMAAAVASLLATAVGGKDGVVLGGPGGVGGLSSATATPKKGAAATTTSGGGSWRLWPFGARRDPSGRTSATGVAAVPPSAGSAGFAAGSPPLTSPLAMRQGSSGAAGLAAYSAPLQRQASSGLGAGEEGEGPAAPSASRDVLSGRGSGSRRVREDGVAVITKKSLTPPPEQLAALPLRHGQNTITYKIGSTELKAYVYYLPWRTKIVISDIDGTITKSDVLGHLLPAMGLDWSHPGIAQLLTNIRQNNYLIMYLSSRSIGQANITRDFINSLVQGEHRMPLGPVIISPHGLLPSLYREMILRRPHEFKIATLQDIRALFPPDWNPFYGGFGNRDTDEISYKEVGMQPNRIFIINPRGELRQPAGSVADPTIAAALSTISAAAAAATAVSASAASAPVLATAASGTSASASLASALPTAASEPPPATDSVAVGAAAAAAAAVAAASGSSTNTAGATPERQASDASAATASTITAMDLATVSAPVPATSTPAPPAPPARSATVPLRGRGAAADAAGKAGGGAVDSKGAAVAALSLSAINELVHDLFPPLKDGEPVASSSLSPSSSSSTSSSSASSGSVASPAASEQGQPEGEEEADAEQQEAPEGAAVEAGEAAGPESAAKGCGDVCAGQGKGAAQQAVGGGQEESADGVASNGSTAAEEAGTGSGSEAAHGSGASSAVARPQGKVRRRHAAKGKGEGETASRKEV